MIADPPLSDGGSQVASMYDLPTPCLKDNLRFLGTPGLLGAVSVVPDTVLVQAPVPTELTAATCTSYRCPHKSPVSL